MIGFPRLAQADHLIQGQVAVAKVVGTERNLIADRFADGSDDLYRAGDAPIRKPCAGTAAGRTPMFA